MAKKNLYSILENCATEEEVKSEFARFFKFKIDTKDRIDHYTTQILYEFKYDMELSKVKQRAKCIAQTLYYVRFLKYGNTSRVVPPYIAVIDKNEAFFVETVKFHTLYTKDTKYDWDRQPSNPCHKLIDDVAKRKEIVNAHVYNFKIPTELDTFIKKREEYSSEQLSIFDTEKKVINEDNFLEVFEYWNELFGNYVKNGHKPSEYFLTDVQEGKAFRKDPNSNKVYFELSDGTAIIKTVPVKDYEYFWNTYERTSDPIVIYSMRQKMDRLTEDYRRRFTGEFFTPVEFAQKALDYLERTVGRKWWETGEYRLWDMAAGTGNLEFDLPSSALQYCYLSTLDEDDVNYCQKIFPNATCFQYDYLNDDVELLRSPLLRKSVNPKMPQKLVKDLNDPNIKWIILLNPPFATSNTMGNVVGKKSKDTVSMTTIRSMMNDEDLGETSRELFSQFVYRISREFIGKTTYLGLFSKLKYLNSNNDEKLRDKVFKHKFCKGFIFPSNTFSGAKGSFPVGFLIWLLNKGVTVNQQTITVDVYDEFVGKYGEKTISTISRTNNLNQYATRHKNTEIFPPFSNALKIAYDNKDTRDRIAAGFICSLMCNGSDIAHQNYTALFSGPSASAGGFTVGEWNFSEAMITHAVRRLPVANWINDRDQYYQPYKQLPNDFISDCVIWSAFSNSNNTVSMKDIKYKGQIYNIHNQMYPYLLESVRKWHCGLDDIQAQIISENEERFLAKWIHAHKLTEEGKAVYVLGRKLYKEFYSVVHETNWLDYKIGLWDVGWYQVKKVIQDTGDRQGILSEIKKAHQKLGDKLLPEIYEYGFLPEPMVALD